MSDHFAARMLNDLHDADGLDEMDFGDYVELVGEAVNDPEGLAGHIPDGYDANVAYDALVSDRLSRDMASSLGRIVEYFNTRDQARHASARSGIIAANGAGDVDYEAAVFAKESGDPSPLLAMQTRYLSTI